LLANPDYQIAFESKQSPMNQVAEGVQDVMKRALWDTIKADLEGGNYDRLFTLIEELKVRLAHLTPSRRDIANHINEVLDIELMEQQLKQQPMQQWNLLPFIRFVVQHIRDLESPIRNEETDKWLQNLEVAYPSTEKPAVLREFFDFTHMKLDLISLDTTNLYLRTISPVIAEYGIEFYRKKFEEKLAKGQLDTSRTASWASGAKTGSLSVSQLHREGVLYLILPHFHGSKEATFVLLPETMQDEEQEIGEMRIFARKIWRIAFALLRIRQLVPDASKEMLNEVFILLSAEFDQFAIATKGRFTIVSPVSKEATSVLYTEKILEAIQSFQTIHAKERDALVSLLEKVFNPSLSDPSYAIICKRLYSVFESLVVSLPADPVDTQLKALNMLPLLPLVVSLSAEISRFCSRDMKIHASLYSSLFLPALRD